MSGKIKKKNRIISIFLLILCMLLPACVALPESIQADETGSVTLVFPLSGAEFSIYEIGKSNQSGGYTLDEPFASYGVNLNSSDAAATLAGYVTSDEIAPKATVQVSSEGSAVFENLEEGVYLILGGTYTQDNVMYITSPVMLELPQWQSKDLVWDVTVEAKYEKDEIKPDTTKLTVSKVWKSDDETTRPASVTVQLLKDGKAAEGIKDADGKDATVITLNADNSWTYTWPELESGSVWTVAEKDVPSGYTVSNSTNGTNVIITNTSSDTPKSDTPSKLPQTGLLWWPVPILVAVGLFLILLGLLIRKHNE